MKRTHGPLFLVGLVTASVLAQAGIPEPDTIFFGRIINRTGGTEYQITDGELRWTVQSLLPGGTPLVLRGRIEPWANGAYSYRLKVPHEAVDLSLVAAARVVPLGMTEAAYHHQEIRVNGHLAAILPPAAPALQLGQARRAAAYRLDLETFDLLPDRNANGLPDWWEGKYALSISDAEAPIPAGGLSYLQAYRLGLDPRVNPTSPILLTDRISVVEDGIALVALRVLDTDTPPERLIYTLVRPPADGSLHRRQGGELGPALGVSTQFNQADVEHGRLVLRTQGDPAGLTFEVSLRDENPEHTPAKGTIIAEMVRPGVVGDGVATLWLDATRPLAGETGSMVTGESGTDPTLWLDRSGHRWTARAASDDALSWSARTPAGRAALTLDGVVLDLPSDAGTAVVPSGERTMVAVFRTTSEARQTLFSTPHFGLGVSGPADPGGDGRLRLTVGSESYLSSASVHGRWTVASVSTRTVRPELYLDGIPAVGSRVSEPGVLPASHVSIGARTTGRFEAAVQSWRLDREEPFEGELAELLVFDRVLSTVERQRVEGSLASKWLGVVVADGSRERTTYGAAAPSAGFTNEAYEREFVPAFGRDRSHLLIGGFGDNTLAGGMEDDRLIAGPGNNRLSGGGGRDVFVFNSSATGTNVIADFSVSDGDVLDFSGLLQGSSIDLADYVRLQFLGTSTRVDVSVRGEGADYTDLQITLANVSLPPGALGELWTQRQLLTGQLVRYRPDSERGPTIVSVAAAPATGEADAVKVGAFTVNRTGSLEAGLTVGLHVGGSAGNGVDYSYLPGEVTFAPGTASVLIPIELYPDHSLAGTKVVELTLLTGDGYTIGSPARAQISLRPLPERISIRAGQSVATRSDPMPGTFIVTRTSGLDHATVVPLRIGGSAVNGLDYDRLAASVTFPAGTASVILTVNPKTARPVLSAPLLVAIELLPDSQSSYVLGQVNARVALVEVQLDFDYWRTLQGLDLRVASTVASGQDPDADRLPNLAEYAFGLDPKRPDTFTARESLPRARLREGRLTVTFRRPLAITDLRYQLQSSTDLVRWTDADADFEPIQLPEFADQAEMVSWTEKNPTGQATARKYVRVQVRRP